MSPVFVEIDSINVGGEALANRLGLTYIAFSREKCQQINHTSDLIVSPSNSLL